MRVRVHDVKNGKWLVTVLAATLLCACAPVQDAPKQARKAQLIYPAAPDEPRFVFERTITRGSDITSPKSDVELKKLLVGSAEAGGETLSKPYAVAVHKGRIFVSDTVDRVVKVFDVPTGKVFRIGEDDPGMLTAPLGLDVDAQGNLYVADSTQKIIYVFDRDGKFLRKIGVKGFDRLTSVTVDPAGRRVYAVDIGGVSSEMHRVRAFDAVTGNHLFDIGKRGTGPGEFNLPRDVAIGKDGNLYVVDGGNFRVQVFDPNGKYLNSFGSVGKNMGNFARPKEVATDPDGNVYVIDAAFGNFQIFNAEGELLMYIGERSELGGPARYMLPSGIFVDEDGRVYVVDQWFRKVDVYRPYALASEAGYLGKRARPLSGVQ